MVLKLTCNDPVVGRERAVVLESGVGKELAVQLGVADLELLLEGLDVRPAEAFSETRKVNLEKPILSKITTSNNS